MAEFEKKLRQIDLIYDYSITKFNKENAIYEIIFNGTTNKFVKFVKDSQTSGGLNWQVVNQLRRSGYFKSLEKSVNNILKRLNKN